MTRADDPLNARDVGERNSELQAQIAEAERREAEQAAALRGAVFEGSRLLVNSWRELAEEMQRILEFMSQEQRDDLLPDWFAPRLAALLAGHAGP